MLHTTITPNGLCIAYEDGEPDDDGKCKRRSYTVDGEKHPSVTTIGNVLAKPGLQYGAEKLTVDAMLYLAQSGLDLATMTREDALKMAGAAQLRFRQVWDFMAELGTDLHEEPLSTWLPDFEVEQHEQPIASKHYGFAGRFDYFGLWEGLTTRLDIKTVNEIPRYADGTPKAPYTENLCQLGGYEIGAAHSGYPAAAQHAILRVERGSGDWDLFISPTIGEHMDLFLKALDLYRGLALVGETARSIARSKM